MYKVQLLNNIKSEKLSLFDKTKYDVSADVQNPDALMLRSAKIHDMQFNSELLCIARAGAGVNNIPIDRCADEGIVVFNTPGANAGAVKEIVLAALLISSRDIIAGIDWVREAAATNSDDLAALVEKEKSRFAGPEIYGKTIGIIGLGAIGAKIAETALSLGMNVYGYDPYLSVEAAWMLSAKVKKADDLDTIYSNCDYISINVPYMESTKHFINKDAIAKMKKGVRVINAARGELVNDDDMIEALASGHVAKYVTDFPNAKTAGAKGVIPIPHLGASTPEAEDNCVSMAAEEIIEYIENGNIINSVNFPRAVLPPKSSQARICIIHDNVPEMIAKITSAVSSTGANIDNMLNASKKGNSGAYTMLDVDKLSPGLEEAIKEIPAVTRVRILQ